MAVTATILASCGGAKTTTAEADKFDYTVEQFADLQILRYKVPEFETLTLKQKELVYYLDIRLRWKDATSCLIRTESIT